MEVARTVPRPTKRRCSSEDKKTLYQKTKLLESLKNSSQYSMTYSRESQQEQFQPFLHTKEEHTSSIWTQHMTEREEKKKIFSSCNCSILSAFQFPSEVPSVGTDFLGAVTQSSNTEALSFKSFKSFPKFHSYW